LANPKKKRRKEGVSPKFPSFPKEGKKKKKNLNSPIKKWHVTKTGFAKPLSGARGKEMFSFTSAQGKKKEGEGPNNLSFPTREKERRRLGGNQREESELLIAIVPIPAIKKKEGRGEDLSPVSSAQV